MFANLQPKPADAILKLIAEHAKDPRQSKIDLGVGVYRDAEGNTPVLESVKKAERWLVASQASKAYLGSRGDRQFCDSMQDMTFGENTRDDVRIATLQSPGGSGGLRVAAGLILETAPDAVVWVSDPTWNNHTPLLAGAGVKLQPYPYYDAATNDIRFDHMMEALRGAAAGDLVLLHGCCHNPTGMDLGAEQWLAVAELIAERELVPFVDLAYQGFAESLEDDAGPVRLLYQKADEMLVTTSCSKNFGLYRDRVGTLSIVAADAATAAVVDSHAMRIVRTMYSVPPDHGAAVVAHILQDDELRTKWLSELSAMRQRLKEMRHLLVDALNARAAHRDWSHLLRANGMFSYLGVTPDQVQRLKSEFGIYLVDSGRINVCGITAANVEHLADSVTVVLAGR